MSSPPRMPAPTPRPVGGLCLALAYLLFVTPVLAAPVFPVLSGRVVDQAGMLDAAAEQRLDDLLRAHESAGSDQVVVVTLNDLAGEVIEDYGYQLGRHWGIGQKDKNNGVLLIVAQQERKVRIEVGYGLEGTLTDAISANIIHQVILPNFKAGRFAEGIEAGATAIVQALGGEYVQRSGATRSRSSDTTFNVIFLIFVLFIMFMRLLGFGGRGGYYGGSGYSGGGGGGFSGGGGSFGGGGASGGW